MIKLTNNKDHHFLEIKGNVLKEGEVYELQLSGNLTEEIKNSKLYTFTTNESPSSGNCTVDKTEGVVLVTNFTFTCLGWKDEDKQLTYQFGYTSNTGATEIIQQGPHNFLKTNKLPLGDSEKENTVRVDIYIKDEWGGYAMKSVTVKVRVLLYRQLEKLCRGQAESQRNGSLKTQTCVDRWTANLTRK